MNKFSRTARSVTFAAIVGLSLGVSAPGAFAETAGEIANRATKGQSTITQETGTFTVHKRANQDPSNEKKPTGEVVPDAPGIPLKDATFTLYEITKNGRKIDLKTNESILEASSLVKKGWSTSDGQETYTTEGGYSAKKITSDEAAKKTTGEGTAVWDKLPIGAYLVVETDAPPSYEKSAPFVAFVPMTKGNAVQDGEAGDLGKGTEWNYDVHAYPKNYKNEAKKEVEDTNQQVGQDIVFSIVGDIPKVLGEKGLTKFEFVDDLNEQKVTFKENSEKLGAGHQNKAYIEVLGGDGQVLTTFGPEKYELEHVTGTEKLNVRLNEDGLREINTTYKETAKKLKLSFAASVIQAGELKNEATVITNNGNGQGDTETKTNETVSYWATVKIVKKDGTGEKTLQGAIFALYGSKDAVCSKDDLVERNKISTGSGGEKVQKTQDTWETNGEGVAIINGLHVNDWDDNSPVSDDQYRAYCLVEKQAPQGYELLSKPIQLELKKTNASTFSASTTDKAVDVQATKTIDVYEATATVKNVEDKTPNLPMTGGAGVGILAAIGAAIIGAGAWFARRNSAES